MQWTVKNPGAGDLSVLDSVTIWVTDCASAIEDAKGQLNKVVSSLPTVWTGQGAGGLESSLRLRMSELTEAEDALAVVKKALETYVGDVEQIKKDASVAMADRDEAALTKNQQYLDSTSNPPDAEERARRKKVHDDAVADYDAAVDKLGKLAELRADADQAFGGAVLGAASEAWSGAPFFSWGSTSARGDANDTVWELYEEFKSGDGPQTRLFTDGDAFTEWLKQSSHIQSVRGEITSLALDGKLVPGQVLDFDRSISNNFGVLAEDGLTMGSLGNRGNLPQTFLGSYNLTVTVQSVDAYGNAQLTYTIDNDTTVDSFTRIPGTGGAHAPWHDDLQQQSVDGTGWVSTHQTVVWTETYHIPGYVPPGEFV